jgi:hypothetical protein
MAALKEPLIINLELLCFELLKSPAALAGAQLPHDFKINKSVNMEGLRFWVARWGAVS